MSFMFCKIRYMDYCSRSKRIGQDSPLPAATSTLNNAGDRSLIRELGKVGVTPLLLNMDVNFEALGIHVKQIRSYMCL